MANIPAYAFQLKNDTNLPSGFSVRTLGFSVASSLYLQEDSTSSLKWGGFPDSFTQGLTVASDSATVVFEGISAYDRISVGDAVTGNYIPKGTTVEGVSVNVTLSNPASASGQNKVEVNVVSMVGGTVTAGSPVITNLAPPPSLSSIRLGQILEGPGIPSNSTVTKITQKSGVTISNTPTTSGAFTGASAGKFNQKCTGDLISGSTSADLSGVSSSDQIVANLSITGAGIPTNTIIQQVNSVTITLSQKPTDSGTTELSFGQSQSANIAGTSVTGLSSAKNLGVGYPVKGEGIPAGTLISEINGNTEITLTKSASSATNSSVIFPPASGIIPSFDIDSYKSFDFNAAIQTDGLDGARIYFFVVPDSWPALGTEGPVMGYPTNPPGFPYAWNGTGFGIQQPNNPPNTPHTTSGFSPFGVVEPTIDPGAKGGLLHIDVQTVDGFSVPLTLTLKDSSSTELGQVGQPLGSSITRKEIIQAYQTQFTTAPYSDLVYGNANDIDGQYPGILNPGAYLAANDSGNSSLKTMWDATLKTLFEGKDVQLNMIGDDGDYYKGVPSTCTVGGLTYHVIEFTGYTDSAMSSAHLNGNVFRIFDPRKADPLAPNYTMSAGYQVFANDGVFNNASTNAIVSSATGGTDTPEEVIKGLERDFVCALNRGMALTAPYLVKDALGNPITRKGGDTSAYWGTETNWYPAAITDVTAAQNQFSLFMHTAEATVAGSSTKSGVVKVPIFTQPAHPASTATGLTMGMAYGFAYDENPVHGASGQAEVPSKFDPVPANTTTVVITAGEW